jgi:hypothetical protein
VLINCNGNWIMKRNENTTIIARRKIKMCKCTFSSSDGRWKSMAVVHIHSYKLICVKCFRGVAEKYYSLLILHALFELK